MKYNIKRAPYLFLITLLISSFCVLLSIWQIKKPKTSFTFTSITPYEKNIDPSYLHEQKNKELKEWSIKYSPDGKKAAFYQNKFVTDIKNIGDPDYTSLIVEQGGRTDIVFQGNFHLSHFEWLDNDKIKVYKGCGSSCLLSYVVNINTKQFKESVEKIFSYN